MKRRIAFTLLLIVCAINIQLGASSFEEKFQWVKQTFEENDAGFQMVLDRKGQAAYDSHNQRIAQKIESAKDLNECLEVLREWLRFFRSSGHLELFLTQQVSIEQQAQTMPNAVTPEYWGGDIAQFRAYLSSKKEVDYEGIWDISGDYKVGIIKERNSYIGFIIESTYDDWLPNMVKLKIEDIDSEMKSTYYMRDFTPRISGKPVSIGNHVLQIGVIDLKRLYPELKPDPYIENYLRFLTADKPYIEQLNRNTLYLRIPSFYFDYSLENLIKENMKKITKTENLIIDLRNNGGGDIITANVLYPILYTNPIQTPSFEFLASPLNIKRISEQLEQIESNEMYKNDAQLMQQAKDFYDNIKNRVGEFVFVDGVEMIVHSFDKILKSPKNVGVIVNHISMSATEEFAIAAKQSKKVKIFGTVTYGAIDTGAVTTTTSPCGELVLMYCAMRNPRTNYMQIDEIGVQPDFLIDSSVPDYKWVEYVNDMMQNWGTAKRGRRR